MFVDFHRSAAGVAWRWRTELTLLVVFTAALWRLILLITLFWAIGRHRRPGPGPGRPCRPPAGSSPGGSGACWPATGCTGCATKPACTPGPGACPWSCGSGPTKVGERAHLLCRAGICAEDFEAHIGELRAACYAREARVTRNRRWSQLVTIDIIRRDTLAASYRSHPRCQRLTALYQIDTRRSNPGRPRPGRPRPGRPDASEAADDTDGQPPEPPGAASCPHLPEGRSPP